MLYKKYTILYTLGILCLFNSSCSQKQGIGYDPINRVFIIEDDEALFIHNTSSEKIDFLIDVNDQFACNLDALVKQVRQSPNEIENESEIRKAWRFVSTKLDFFQPISTSQHLDIPLLIYNSLGYGHCDDFCILLNAILMKMGYQTRVIGVNDHVVLEVMNNGRWEMYDPFLYVYYMNSNGEVANIEELSRDSTLITSPIQKINHKDFASLERGIRYLDSYKMNAAKYFYNSNPYIFHTKNYLLDSIKIELPASSIIEFPVSSPDPIYKQANNGRVPHQTYIKYTLPKNLKTKLEIPFLISSINGIGKVKV